MPLSDLIIEEFEKAKTEESFENWINVNGTKILNILSNYDFSSSQLIDLGIEAKEEIENVYTNPIFVRLLLEHYLMLRFARGFIEAYNKIR